MSTFIDRISNRLVRSPQWRVNPAHPLARKLQQVAIPLGSGVQFWSIVAGAGFYANNLSENTSAVVDAEGPAIKFIGGGSRWQTAPRIRQIEVHTSHTQVAIARPLSANTAVHELCAATYPSGLTDYIDIGTGSAQRFRGRTWDGTTVVADADWVPGLLYVVAYNAAQNVQNLYINGAKQSATGTYAHLDSFKLQGHQVWHGNGVVNHVAHFIFAPALTDAENALLARTWRDLLEDPFDFRTMLRTPTATGPTLTLSAVTANFPTGCPDAYDSGERRGGLTAADGSTFQIHRKYTLSDTGQTLEWRLRNTVTEAVISDWADVPGSAITINPRGAGGEANEIWVRRDDVPAAQTQVDIDVRIKSAPAQVVLGTLKWQRSANVEGLGQSNQAGLGSTTGETNPADTTTRLINRASNIAFRGTESYAGDGDAWLAATWATTAGYPAVVCNAAVGGSDIESWRNGGSNWSRVVDDHLRLGRLNGLVMNIGEANSVAPGTWANFGANIAGVASDVRTLTGQTAATLPLVIVVTGGIQGGNASGLDAIREAILAAHNPANGIYVSFSAVGFALLDEGSGDVHYTGANYVAAGVMQGRSLLEIAGLVSAGTAVGTVDPAFTGSSRTGDNLDLTVTHQLGTDITVPAGVEDAIKVRLVSGGSAVTPTSITRLNATTVRVVLPGGTGAVEWRNVQGDAFALAGTGKMVADNSTLVSGGRPVMPTNGWQTPATVSVLVIADAVHGHAADSLSLSTAATLATADASHAHSADGVSLTTASALVVADASHAHTVDAVSLSTAVSLSIADALSAHVADNVTLSSGSTLVTQDAAHGHSADAPSLSVASTLSIADASHAQLADSLVLASGTTLSVADATSAHVADSVALLTLSVLSVSDAVHAHAADAVTLISGAALSIADAVHAHAAENVSLSTIVSLTIADAAHAHLADMVTLTLPGSLVYFDVAPRLTLVMRGLGTTLDMREQ